MFRTFETESCSQKGSKISLTLLVHGAYGAVF